MRPRLLIVSALAAISLLATAVLPRVQAATDLLVKASGPALYYVAADNKRYVFPNQAVYNSWYRDFSSVQTISDSALASYPIGGTIFYRPGTRMVKLTTDPKVYAVGVGGALYPIASEAAALKLYGANWSKRIDDLSDAFFAGYQVQGELDGSQHPIGTFFRYTENTSYYYLTLVDNVATARPLNEQIMAQFRFDKANAVAISSQIFAYNIGDMIHADEGSLFVTAQTPLGNPPTSPTTPTTPGTPTPSPQPGTTASITLAAISTAKPTSLIVKGDDAARLYAFTVDGDATVDVTIKRVTMTVYIDAGGTDTDYSAGFDADEPVFWSLNQLLSTFALRDAATGQVFDSRPSLEADGTVSFTTNISIPSRAKRTIELTAAINTVGSNIRISADLIPSTGLVLTSNAATTIAKPSTGSLNGGITPSIIVTPVEFGTLTVESTSSLGDSIHSLDENIVPYSLLFTADGEPFVIGSFSIGFVSGGTDIYAINHLSIAYTNEVGVKKAENESFVDSQTPLFRFTNQQIYVPKGQTVTVPITLSAKNDPTLYSGARIAVKFDPAEFSATSQYGQFEYTNDYFADTAKLRNKTSSGPLMLYRQGIVTIGSNTESPTGTVTRYNKQPLLTFNISAQGHAISVHQLTFKVESSDIDEDGDDNDFFERVANIPASQVVGIASHNQQTTERRYLGVQSVVFKLYDASTSTLDDTPNGIATAPGDYGIFVINFGSSPITVAAGQTTAYDFDLDTTLLAFEEEETIKVRLLGDAKGNATSQAYFLWSDGSNIQTSGYLVNGLDLIGSTIAVR